MVNKKIKNETVSCDPNKALWWNKEWLGGRGLILLNWPRKATFEWRAEWGGDSCEKLRKHVSRQMAQVVQRPRQVPGTERRLAEWPGRWEAECWLRRRGLQPILGMVEPSETFGFDSKCDGKQVKPITGFKQWDDGIWLVFLKTTLAWPLVGDLAGENRSWDSS